MKEIVSMGPKHVTRMHRDDHDESGKYYFHTIEDDEEILHRNKRIRLEGIAPKGIGSPILDGDVLFAFSCPPAMFRFFMRDNPDIEAGLQSNNEQERNKAARRLALLKPEWCLMASNR